MRTSVMIANGIIVAAALVWLLVLLVSLLQPYRSAPIRAAYSPAQTPAARAVLERGWYGLVLRLDGIHQLDEFKLAIDEIAAMNANAVLLETPVLQETPDAIEVSLEGVECPLLNDLVAVIEYAQERGLGVVLIPTLVFHDVKVSQSRSRFAPADWDRWWVSYEAAIVRLAGLAQTSGVEVFAVGSELSESEIMSTQWVDLVSQVRGRYSGLVMYNAQWERAPRVDFWQHLDMIGVSAWFSMIHGEDQSLTSLETIWERALRETDLLAAETGRPVLFTAVGYPSRAEGLADPWDAAPSGDELADEQLQALALSAFLNRFEALEPPDPHYGGFFIYRWGVGDEPVPDPFSHVIKTKQAEPLVRDALGRLANP